eukprot:GFKZ01008373.1.p2 GENE.GFKZ01008373.1~~GFKZ01008373.1.p2  ORF type:complete len:102 (-),score=7.76 GFKZ01008373.1:229-534(-)
MLSLLMGGVEDFHFGQAGSVAMEESLKVVEHDETKKVKAVCIGTRGPPESPFQCARKSFRCLKLASCIFSRGDRLALRGMPGNVALRRKFRALQKGRNSVL